MERDQQERFAAAVERKKADADARSRATGDQTPGGSAVDEEIQPSEIETGRPQDTYSVRDKNAGRARRRPTSGTSSAAPAAQAPGRRAVRMKRRTAVVALKPDGFALAGRPPGPERLPGQPSAVPPGAERSTRMPAGQPR